MSSDSKFHRLVVFPIGSCALLFACPPKAHPFLGPLPRCLSPSRSRSNDFVAAGEWSERELVPPPPPPPPPTTPTHQHTNPTPTMAQSNPRTHIPTPQHTTCPCPDQPCKSPACTRNTYTTRLHVPIKFKLCRMWPAICVETTKRKGISGSGC